MSTITIAYGETYEDSPAVFMARVVGADGNYITTSTVTSITLEVWDRDTTATAAVATATVAVGTSVFDTMQTGVEWQVDDTGYNFAYTMATSVMSTAGHRYLAQFDIVPTAGGSYPIQFEVVTRKRY